MIRGGAIWVHQTLKEYSVNYKVVTIILNRINHSKGVNTFGVYFALSVYFVGFLFGGFIAGVGVGVSTGNEKSDTFMLISIVVGAVSGVMGFAVFTRNYLRKKLNPTEQATHKEVA